MASATITKGKTRSYLAWVALGLCALALAWLFDPKAVVEKLGLGDFIAYWSAGRQLSRGENPYDWRGLLELQEPLGWAESFPNMMYYPPWTLALVLPFGAMEFAVARLAWLLLHVGITVWSADWIWRYYGGRASQRYVAWLIALVFVPTMIALRMGQIGPMLLFGIIAFLHFERRGQDWWAGAALLLPAIKPQLLYLFGFAVLLWALDRRRYRILLGGLIAMLAATCAAMAFDPRLLVHYQYAFANPPSINITPTLGAMLRLAFGEEKTWLQYLPTAIGLIWFVPYWIRRRQAWHWDEQAPVLVLASFLTTAYGAWVFDLVVLLLPILHLAVGAFEQGATRAWRLALAAFMVIDLVALAMNLAEATYPMFIWITPTVFVAYMALRCPLHIATRGETC
jgi:hypothetical protein